jgi:crotonobetaine/carnitine-CoA ligase
MATNRIYEPGDEIETCGRPTAGFEIRLVDELDYDVPFGEVGEAIIRSTDPWGLNLGYLNMPAETAQAWRNGWFHTGDGLRQNPDGAYVFVDRLKDALRRRGENVSSFELESLVLTHPAVAECAVIGVGDSLSDQEIKLCVVRQPDEKLEPSELVEFLEPHVPRFMVPRYVEFYDALPRTDVTARVKKHLLREQALTVATWDRLAR